MDYPLIDLLSISNKKKDLSTNVVNALEILKKDILEKSKFFEGDLLMTLLAVNQDFWKTNPDLWQELNVIIDFQFIKIKNHEASFEMKGEWYEKIERFKKMF